jgi:hypothetical protein
MFDNMDPWALVPIVGVIGWAVVAGAWIFTNRLRDSGGGELKAALDASAEANRQVAEQLAAIDRRLAAVEKTLTDIG